MWSGGAWPAAGQVLQAPGRACYRLRTPLVVRGDVCPAPRVEEWGVRLPGAAEGRAWRGREPRAVLSCHVLPAFVWPRCGRGAPPASGEGLYPALPAPAALPAPRPVPPRVATEPVTSCQGEWLARPTIAAPMVLGGARPGPRAGAVSRNNTGRMVCSAAAGLSPGRGQLPDTRCRRGTGNLSGLRCAGRVEDIWGGDQEEWGEVEGGSSGGCWGWHGRR